MRSAILIYNPASGSALKESAFNELLAELRQSGFEATPAPTRGPGDATRLAREHALGGAIEVAFALGGDGTLREVAAGLLGTEVALGPLPAGTANVLSFEFGLSKHPQETAKSFAQSRVRSFDVGFASDIPFLMMVSGGFEAKVMSNQNAAMKRRFGPAAVLASGLKQFFTWHSPWIEIEVDGEREKVVFFTVCNIPFFGGPFRIAPGAEASDGQLDLVTLKTPGKIALISFLFGVLLGRHTKRKDVTCRRFKELKILGPMPWGLQIDGDVLASALPASVTVRPKALRVLVPNNS